MKHFLMENYYLAAVCVIALGIWILLVWCDRKLQAKEIVVLASLSGIAVVSRLAFFWLPQWKPMTAFIFTSGSIFGPMSGMLVGVLSAFLSNFIFGQGPWTPFQMLALGFVGLIGGMLQADGKRLTSVAGKQGRMRKPQVLQLDGKWVASVIAFLTVLLVYGPIVNFASYLMMNQEMNWQGFWIIELSGLPFDLIHAVSTVVFLFFIWNPMRGKLMRLKTKYRILQRSNLL